MARSLCGLHWLALRTSSDARRIPDPMGVALALFANIHAGRIFAACMKNTDPARKLESHAAKINGTMDWQGVVADGRLSRMVVR